MKKAVPAKKKTAAPSVPPRDVPDKAVPDKNFLSGFSDKAAYVVLTLLFLVGFIVYKDYLFLRKLYLFTDIGSDTVTFCLPDLANMADYLRKTGLPGWSFSMGLGQNAFVGAFTDLFNCIHYLAGKNNIIYSVAYVQYIKVILAGFLFYSYLSKFVLSAFSRILGALLFAFSSFLICGGGWYIFSTEAVLAVFLLLAFEMFFKNSRWYMLPVAMGLISIYGAFYVYLYTFFLFVYALFRYVSVHPLRVKPMLAFFTRLTSVHLLGILLASVILFPNVWELLQSPRVSGEASLFRQLLGKPVFETASFYEYQAILARFFSDNTLGTGDKYQGWQNFLEAPMYYCGLITLLAFPQVFHSISRKQRILYGTVLALVALSLFFPFFRHMVYAFSGDYYRSYSFFISIILLLLFVHALQNILVKAEINVPLLAVTLVLLLGVLWYKAGEAPRQFNNTLLTQIRYLLVFYAILLFLLRYGKYRSYVQVALLLAVCYELIYFSSVTVNERKVVKPGDVKAKTGYFDYSNEAIAWINANDKGFFRVNKDYLSAGLNDALFQGYKSSSYYRSMPQKHYVEFLFAVEGEFWPTSIPNDVRWAPALMTRTFLKTLISTRYHLSKGDRDNSGEGYVRVHKTGDIGISKNKYALPLGITYDAYMKREDFKKFSRSVKDQALLAACILEDETKAAAKKMMLYTAADSAVPFTFDKYKAVTDKLKTDSMRMDRFTENYISGSLHLQHDKVLFFSIPYDKGWTLEVNGKATEIEKVNIGFMGVLLPAGGHTITLSYSPPYLRLGALCSMLGLMVFAVCCWKSKGKWNAI